jgi:hypothetical protein
MNDLLRFMSASTIATYIMTIGATHVNVIQLLVLITANLFTIWCFKQSNTRGRWLMIEFSMISMIGRIV